MTASCAAGPVFVDRALLGEGIGQPIAPVLDEVAGVLGKARMKGGLAGHFRFRIGRHASGDRSREFVLAGIGAHMDVGQVPAIGRRRVVGAGGGDADDVGQRAQQHIVARPRPRLVGDHDAMRVDRRVEEEVDRHPAGARRDALVGQRAVEILRAVGVAGIADVVVIFRRAGEREGVVAAAGVLHHLDQRLHVLVVIFRMQAGHRIARAHQRARRRHVERMVAALVQLARRKALEVGALAAVDIDDLEIVAGLDEIGFRRRRMDAQVEHRIGERIGQLRLRCRADRGAPDDDAERRRRVVAVDQHRSAGRGDRPARRRA